MKNSSLISVIIPNYNSSQYLPRCLTSLINQKYKNIEILVVDDGSTDDSSMVIKHFVEKDKRIRLFFSNHCGAGHARNVGIDNANGDYICFVDSDDYVSTTYVYNLYIIIKKYDSDLSCSGIEIKENGSTKIIKPIVERKETFKQAFITILNEKECGVSLCGKLFSKRILNNIRIPEGATCEDFKFLFSYLPLCEKGISFINYSDYYYVIRDDSVSSFNNTVKQSDYDAVYVSFYGLAYLKNNYRDISKSIYKILFSNIAKLVYKISYNGMLSIIKNIYIYNRYKFFVLSKLKYISKCDFPIIFKKILYRYAFSVLWFSLFLSKKREHKR